MRQEAKESILRANKERLDRLQAAWKEDQQLKEVRSKSLVAPADKACCSSSAITVIVHPLGWVVKFAGCKGFPTSFIFTNLCFFLRCLW